MQGPYEGDRVRVALASLAAGAAAGAAILAVGTLLFRLLEHPLVLQVAVLAAVALAATVGWRGAATLPDGWWRGITAALAAFGGLMLGALTAVADMLAGVAGLLAYAALLAGASLAARRTARRAAAP